MVINSQSPQPPPCGHPLRTEGGFYTHYGQGSTNSPSGNSSGEGDFYRTKKSPLLRRGWPQAGGWSSTVWPQAG